MEKSREVIENFIDSVFKEEAAQFEPNDKDDYTRGWCDAANFLKSSMYRKMYLITKGGPFTNS